MDFPDEYLVAILPIVGGFIVKVADMAVARMTNRTSESAQFREDIMHQLESERNTRRQDVAELRKRIEGLEAEKREWEQERSVYMTREVALLREIGDKQREILLMERKVSDMEDQLVLRDERIGKLERKVAELEKER